MVTFHKMMEMGFPKEWCEVALRRCGNSLEQAVTFCFEHSHDMDQILATEQRTSSCLNYTFLFYLPRVVLIRYISPIIYSTLFIKQLMEMGFPPSWCTKALAANHNNVDAALTWILSHGEALAAEELGADNMGDSSGLDVQLRGEIREENEGMSGEVGEDGAVLEQGSEVAVPSVNPLQAVSGVGEFRKDLTVEGVPTGGFASVGCRGCLLSEGKWYYEATLKTAGCMQLGWSDAAYQGNAENGDGVGDGPHSWAYDGWRQYRWHDGHTPWGARWAVGDVVGCAIDLDHGTMSFTLNGRADEIGMGVAFKGLAFSGGLYPCASFNRRECLQFNFGSTPFKHAPPGHCPYMDMVVKRIENYKTLVKRLVDAGGDGPRTGIPWALTVDKRATKESKDGSTTYAPGDGLSGLCIEDCLEEEVGREGFIWHTRFFRPDGDVGGSSTVGSRSSAGESSRSQSLAAAIASVSVAADELGDAVGLGTRRHLRSVGSALAHALAGTDGVEAGKAQEGGGTGQPGAGREDGGAGQLGGSKDGTEALLVGLSDQEYESMVEIRDRLMDLSCDLCVLYARRTVLTLLGKWSSLQQRPFTLMNLCSSPGKEPEAEATSLLIRLVTLVSAESQHTQVHLPALSLLRPTSKDLRVVYVESALHTGGAPALQAITPAILDLVVEARQGQGNYLLQSLATFVAMQIIAAAGRGSTYLGGKGSSNSGNPTTRGEGSVGRSRLSGKHSRSSRHGRNITDYHPLSNPSLALVTWITSVLLGGDVDQAEGGGKLACFLLETWVCGLSSADMNLKLTAFSVISAILQGLVFCHDGAPPPEDADASSEKKASEKDKARRRRVMDYLDKLPVTRLHALTLSRLWTERASQPVMSRYVQALVELSITIRLSQDSVSLDPTRSASDHRNSSTLQDLPPDASMPRMLPPPPPERVAERDFCHEWDSGLVMSDEGWELWSGVVKQHKVKWAKGGGSASTESISEHLRSAHDSSDSPPLLLPGCKVIKGPDWSSAYANPCTASEETNTSQCQEYGDGREDVINTGENSSSVVPELGRDNLAMDTDDSKSEESLRQGEQDAQEDVMEEIKYGGGILEENLEGAGGDVGQEDDNREKLEGDIHSSLSPTSLTSGTISRNPVGTVEEIISWEGNPGLGRRVRWPDNSVGDYRWGGEGCLDLVHVEVDDDGNVKKRHSPPQTRESVAAKHGFGAVMTYGVLLRIRPSSANPVSSGRSLHGQPGDICFDVANSQEGTGVEGHSPGMPVAFEGVLEWPDFCAAARVVGLRWADGTLEFREESLLSGTADLGWLARFGDDAWRSDTVYRLTLRDPSGVYKEGQDLEGGHQLCGSFSYSVPMGVHEVMVTGDMRLGQNDLFTLSQDGHAPSVTVSSGGRMATCCSSDSRGTVYGTVGFSRGVHYWEVKVVQGEPGCIFIGVAEKPSPPSVGGIPRLTRWQGLGFVNYRATYHNNNERVYGDHFHSGDTVGVRLDMEKGTLSFFLDGMKYGAHVISDLGVAFENLAGGRPKLKPRTFFPTFGFRKNGDRITITGKWLSSPGTHPSAALDNATAVASLLCTWEKAGEEQSSQEHRSRPFGYTKAQGMVLEESASDPAPMISPRGVNADQMMASDEGYRKPKYSASADLPKWLYQAAWQSWNRWRSGRWHRITTRAQSGLMVDLDCSPLTCVKCSLLLGLRAPVFAGDRVRLSVCGGRSLEQKEVAVVLGAYKGRLFYRIESQRNEAASEGSSVAWCWSQNDIDGMELLERAPGIPKWVKDIPLNPVAQFKGCRLQLVYSDGAVIRDGVEIDTSELIGTIDQGAFVEAKERRVNSSNIVRYLINHKGTTGWISERIRGGDEDLIVRRLPESVGKRSEIESSGLEDLQRSGDKARMLKSKLDSGASAFDMDLVDRLREWEASVRAHAEKHHEGVTWLVGLHCMDENEEDQEGEDQNHTMEGFMELASRTGRAGTDGCWKLEQDMQIAELTNELCDLFGQEPHNLDFTRLYIALAGATGTNQGEGVERPSDSGEAQLYMTSVASMMASPDKQGLSGISALRLLARVAVLRAFNDIISRALPLMSLNLPEEDWEKHTLGSGELVSTISSVSPVTGGADGYGGIHSQRDSLLEETVPWKPPCTGRRLRALRRLVFTHTKRSYWEGILVATSTATPLHHDEFEDPMEVRLIRINRVRATPNRVSCISNTSERLRHLVFGQLHREMRSWPSSSFRRAYIGKGHGVMCGLTFTFLLLQVNFLGEGVNDYGGPYRAVFEQVVDELQHDQLALGGKCQTDRCLLPLLVPCPNRSSNVGTNQDKFIFNPGPAAISPVTQELAEFLGKMVGMAVRHGLQMGLDLPSTVWRPLVGLPLTLNHLGSIDVLAAKALERVIEKGCGQESKGFGADPNGQKNEIASPTEWEELSFTAHLSDGSQVPLKSGGENENVKLDNWREFVQRSELCRLRESAPMLQAFREGLAAVLPVELFSIFTPKELERLVCGVRQVDVDLLHQCTEYEDTNADSPHVKYFWEVMREMLPSERTAFLRFVWARSRMPPSTKDFPTTFKIQAPVGGAKEHPDDYLPHAQTCFFSLSLPVYSSKEQLRKKLLFAIKNSPNMDADVRLHNAEGWADT
ncbi:unnamed protein product [Choristocarpus tenellus]